MTDYSFSFSPRPLLTGEAEGHRGQPKANRQPYAVNRGPQAATRNPKLASRLSRRSRAWSLRAARPRCYVLCTCDFSLARLAQRSGSSALQGCKLLAASRHARRLRRLGRVPGRFHIRRHLTCLAALVKSSHLSKVKLEDTGVLSAVNTCYPLPVGQLMGV
jgi:hypothetical protein